MPEITDLPSVAPSDVSDDDILVLYDFSAVTDKSRKATRGDFLKDVARTDAEADFTVSEIDELTSDDATFTEATIITSLSFDGGATLSKVIESTVNFTLSASLADGAGETHVETITGALAGDAVLLSYLGAPVDQLDVKAWVSASNEVSFRCFNSTGASLSSTALSFKVVILRFI